MHVTSKEVEAGENVYVKEPRQVLTILTLTLTDRRQLWDLKNIRFLCYGMS